MPRVAAGCSLRDNGGRNCHGLIPHQSSQWQPWSFGSVGDAVRGRTISQCSKQSCELRFSLFLTLLWSLAASKAKDLCKQGSTVHTGCSGSSRGSECSARAGIAAALCAKPLSKQPLLNIILKCHVLSERDAFNGSSHPFLQTFITLFPFPLPRPFPPSSSVKTTMLGINYPKALNHQQ